MSYDAGASGWYLQAAHAVRSVRVTALGAYDKGATSVGVKLVLWPLYNLNAQLGFMDEYTCDKSDGGFYDVNRAPPRRASNP